MNRIFRSILFSSIIIMSATACGGGGDDDDPQPSEADLAITTTPPINGQQEAPAVGPDFPLSVTVTSTMPPQGVKIEVSARTDVSGSAPFYTEVKNTSTKTTNFTITNTPQGTSCRLTVTVSSVSKPSNTVSGFYLYSRK
ncbi:hypothetical protein [Flavihumibacter solisilvae]|nr:hypothetical protein [Flavihumibacter solisilvae]